ncbi:MAG TPA: rhodanese-like domain-containing protein, partial [Myxococcota bacterium]|nr:rhodanese-like domain-containing protein [Myxococcota bacterium]
EGLVRVDDHMATTLPNVYACGSAVSVPHAITHERRWFPQPAIVLRTAHIAGFNAAVDDKSRFDRLKPFCGTIIAEVGDTVFARTGLEEHEARLFFGEDNIFVTTVFGSTNSAFHYDHEMCVKLLVAQKENRVIGGEVFGKNGVLRRIDLMGVAVLEGWAPEKLIDLDMAYLANSGPAFDPLKDAAMRAKTAFLEKEGIITAERLALWLAQTKDFRLVDVGETPLLSGRFGAVTMHLPLESLREHLEELKRESTPIVLYSKSGHRSYLAQSALKQRGLNNVYHLDGGFAIWKMLAPKD